MAVVYGNVHGVWDYAGIAEVAAYLGEARQTVSNWKARWVPLGRFPEPVADLSMGPIWHMCTIRDWARLERRGPYSETKTDE